MNINELILGYENYCKCEYHGEKDDIYNHDWFLQLDKIPIKNGYGIENSIFDYEEIFDIQNENNYYELTYKNKTRYFKKLSIYTFLINKYSLKNNFINVDELIKKKLNFIFLIDCGDFVKIKDIVLSDKILELIFDKKCVVVLNTSYEPFSMETIELRCNIENFSEKYDLNKDNLKILSGNLLSTKYNSDRYEFIPYCYFLENPWFIEKDTHLFGNDRYKEININLNNKKKEFLQKNNEITRFEKKILFYNRRPHPHRKYIFYHLYHDDIIRENSYMSFNNSTLTVHFFNNICKMNEANKINQFYLNRFMLSFDGHDLNINLANNFEEYYHKNTFVSLVSETNIDENVIFFSEKIFKPIYACQPFIISGNAHSLKKLKEFGFKTFDKWWDESYDDEYFFYNRVKKIKNILQEISLKSDEELSKMLIEMTEVLSHNFDIFARYRNQLFYKSLSKLVTNKINKLI